MPRGDRRLAHGRVEVKQPDVGRGPVTLSRRGRHVLRLPSSFSVISNSLLHFRDSFTIQFLSKLVRASRCTPRAGSLASAPRLTDAHTLAYPRRGFTHSAPSRSDSPSNSQPLSEQESKESPSLEYAHDKWLKTKNMPGPLVSISKTLAVTPVARVRGLEAFVSSHLWTPYGARGVFGGQVVAQSLMAACKTVEGKDLHSQHCYFLLPANSSKPITFTVERLRDGKSYATRLVHALQESQTVFILMASFTAPPRALPTQQKDETQHKEREEPSITGGLKFEIPNSGNSALPRVSYPLPEFRAKYQIPFPEGITPWKQAVAEEDQWTNFVKRAQERGLDLGRSGKAVDSYIKERTQSPVTIAIARHQTAGPPHDSTRAVWLKARLGPGEHLDSNTIKVMFGFMTDFQFIGTAGRAVGLSGTSDPKLGMMASLDHTMHFYPLPEDFDPEEPVLHMMEAAAVDVASGRGVVRGVVYSHKGDLLATTLQEGVVRADFSGGKIRPTREIDRNGGAKL